MKKLIFALCLTAGIFSVSNAQILSRIEQFGDTMFTSASAGKIKTVMSGTSGPLIAAFTDNTVSGRLTVMGKDFTQGWINYGSPGISTGVPGSLDLTVDWIGNPIVAYTDPVVLGKVVIQKWNGSSWGYVGGSTGVTTPNAQDVSISFNSVTGDPSIAFKDASFGGKITVMTWDGANWNIEGTPGFSTGNVAYVNIAYSPTLTHNVVAYKDSSDLMAHSMYYNGSTWNYLSGGIAFTGGEIMSMDMEIDSVSGYPMYAVSEFDGANYKASAYIHTGTSNASVGTTMFSPGAASMVNIASDNTGMYVVSFRDATLGNKATVMFNNGGGWNVVPGIFPTGPIGSCDISTEGCGEFFVTYTDSSYQAQANSRRISFPVAPPTITPSGLLNLCPGATTTLTSSSSNYANYEWIDSLRWDTVGTASPFTNGSVIDLAYASEDYSSQKFVAITDGSISGRLVCYSHGGGATPWTVLGGGPITTGYASDLSIKITPTHYPIIAFSDGQNLNKLSVVKWNGSSWVNIGPVSVSAGQASEISMAITTGSKPVVAYQDFSVSNKLTVMYFNGTNWVALGGAGISAGQATEPCVKISPLGEIYVAYSDDSQANKATVRKWTGSAWATIGTAGFTSGSANDPTLDFDGQGNIYMSYKDGAGANGVTVMQYNFSTWSTITTNLSGGTAFKPKIHVDNSANIYVSYIGFPSYLATIMKFNGLGWDTVAHKAMANTFANIFETDLGSTYGMPPSGVISFSPLGDKLIAFNYNYSYAGSFTNTQVATMPGNYVLHAYKCNYSGTLSLNDALIQAAPVPTISISASKDTICAGLADTLVVNGANTYTWFNASTNDTLIINPASTTTYSVVGTSTAGCSDTFNITLTVPTNGFAGTISYTLGAINNGLVYLLPEEVTPGKFDTVAIRSIQPGGTYVIDTIPDGNYLIKAIADSIIYTTTISTYNGNVGVWDSATVIPHNCLSRDTVNIQVLEEYLPTGPGMIGGYVYEGAGFGLRLAQGPGNPSPNANVIPGVPIKVGKNPSGAIVGGTTTDVSGFFQFDSLPCDSYYVYTDVPGYPMDTLYKVTIDCLGGMDTVLNLDYYIDSNSVYIDLTTSISNANTIEKNSSFSVYPNPAHGVLYIKQTQATEGDIRIYLHDISGKEFFSKIIKGSMTNAYPIDLSSFSKGIYLLQIVQEGKTQAHKIVIH